MVTDLNKGDTIFSYRGYLNMSGFSSGNVASLTNGWKMPFAPISTCGTGSFVSETSISEAFLRAGSPTTPKGAVAATGTATWGTHTRYNNAYIYGVLGGLLWENLYTVGADHTRGKTELWLEYGNSNQSFEVAVFSQWNNLMGDPATECWTGYPAAMTASYPLSVPVGTNSVTVTLSELSLPVPGAQVCLWKGTETYVVGQTDGEGRIELPVSLLTSGNLLLTVTKHNHQPILGTIQVVTPDLFVGYLESSVVDNPTPPSQGNGDGVVNPGETIELPVRVKNFGSQDAAAVSAVVSTTDPYATVLSGSSDYGDIAAGATAWGASSFLLQVGLGCPNHHVVRLALDVTSGANQWHSIIDLPVASAEFAYKEHHWYNAGPNGLLDPGETVGLSIGLDNLGNMSALTPTATLISMSEFVTVPVSQVTYPTIPQGAHGENVSAPFTVHASLNCYRGYVAHMKLVLDFSGGVLDTVLVSLPVGTRATTDPTGPDDYGYIAYDDSDLSYPLHPTYSWVEADPAFGGTGTEIVMGDNSDGQDKTVTVTMPFSFNYYGQSYTTASVCSNGWIVMGQTYIKDYRNWTLPSLGGPNGVIAPFWDDLFQNTGSKVVQKYDSANHLWIVEWSRMRNAASSGTVETFEAIFYDPAFYPTETGDGMIRFQYNTIGNVDDVDGYATVGIEKPDNSDAVLYTYFNVYTPGSSTLAANRAILFVPTKEDLTAAPATAQPLRLSLGSVTSNPIRPGGGIHFSLDHAGAARLSVCDVQGRVVRVLAEGNLTAGDHTALWDGRDLSGRDLPSGIYFYTLNSGQRTISRKGILMR